MTWMTTLVVNRTTLAVLVAWIGIVALVALVTMVILVIDSVCLVGTSCDGFTVS